MQIRRLGWAGLEISANDTTLVVDLLEDMSPMAPFTGEARTPLPGPGMPADAALVTHLHSDHADPGAIASALKDDGPVLRPPAADGDGLETLGLRVAEEGLAEYRLKTLELAPWDAAEVGPFTITALPAVDGLGDPQISWAISHDDQTVVHGGDTIFHGYWWQIRMRLGSIDCAFLPINGPVIDLPHRQPPIPFETAMTPVQAVWAAQIMGAGQLVPIHYDAIHNPPVYAEVEDPAGAAVAAARDADLDVRVDVVEVGDEVPRGDY